MTGRLSPELRARITAAVEKSRQRELDFLELLGKIDDHKRRRSKPRIRVKANSRRWSLVDPSQSRIAGE